MATPTPLPPPLEPKVIIDQLMQEILWLERKWNLFHALYGRAESQIHEMNRRTGLVFGMLQDGVRDDVLLSIAKLLDNPEHKRTGVTRYNATFDLAIRRLPATVAEADRAALAARVADLKNQCDAIVVHRNRRIGHVDLAVALAVEPLPPIAWHDVADAMAKAKKLLSDISIAFDGSEIGFFNGRDETREIDTLIRILKLGNDAIDAERDARRQRLTRATGVDCEEPDDPLNEGPSII